MGEAGQIVLIDGARTPIGDFDGTLFRSAP